MRIKRAVRCVTPAFDIIPLIPDQGYPYPNDEVHVNLPRTWNSSIDLDNRRRMTA